MSGVGTEVRRLREAKHWSQTKLAAETGMAVSGVSQIENGHRNPNSATLIKLARALEVEVADLFPKAEAPLWLDDALTERRLIDYRSCREALDRFCDYWEPVLAEGRLDRRACEEFEIAAKLASKLLLELWGVEKVEVQIRHGEDPRIIDVSAPWPRDLMKKKSELWPAIDRWMGISLQIDKIAKERFGEDASGGDTAMGELIEFRRKAG
jgi:transcriptional regulator with XRE-family HTH domain